MTTFVAMLRAVNVGGTGKLLMSQLKQLCIDLGFENVATLGASGNVVFNGALSEREVKARLESALKQLSGKPAGVFVRTAGEMATVLAANPFPDAPPAHTVAVFLDATPAPGMLNTMTGQDGEEVALGRREIYIAFGDKMGRSKLKLPSAGDGTARNMNTIAKLAQMAAQRSRLKH
jgi:uncharacterized protein (DUF1697 family)